MRSTSTRSVVVGFCLGLVVMAGAAQGQVLKGVVRLEITQDAAGALPALFESTRPAGDPDFRKTPISDASVSDLATLNRALGIPLWLRSARLSPWLPIHSVAFPDIRRRSNPELFTPALSMASTGSRSLQDLTVAEEKISRWFVLRFDPTIDPTRVVDALKRSTSVARVEIVTERHTCYTPNDSLVPYQYSLALMNAFSAWDVVRCDSSMLVADVDIGADWSHPDLARAVFVNMGEVGTDSNGLDKRANGVDDDGDGLIDDWHGWDFDGPDAATPDNDTRTTDAHGTHTTGIIAASGDNKSGIVGIAFGAKVLMIKASNDAGQSLDFGFDGIAYAADMHAKVVSCSWGGPTHSQAEQDVIDYAYAKNCAVVAAAGNSGIYQDFFPASYHHVLSVGAMQDGGVVAGYSNYNTGVDVVAPGTDVLSTMPGGWYYTMTGTSMACPNAAGALTLVRARFPDYSVTQAMEQLRVTSSVLDTSASATFSIDSTRYDLLGHGLVNIYKAVTSTHEHAARIENWSIDDADLNGRIEPSETAGMKIQVRNYLAPVSNLKAHVEVVQGQEAITIVTPDFSLGAAGTDELVSNLPVQFQVHAADTIGRNTTVVIKVVLSDSSVGYTRDVDYLRFELNPDFLDLNANNLTVTFSSKGTVGYNDVVSNNEGSGFQWRVPPAEINARGRNVLYQAGLIVASDQDHVVDAIQANSDFGAKHDFVAVDRVHYVEPQKHALQELVARFDDSGADSSRRIGVIVENSAYAFEGPLASNAVVTQYIIHKDSVGIDAPAIINAGFFADWDVGLSGAINSTYFDSTSQIAVTHRLEADYPWVGVKLVSEIPHDAYMNYHAIRNDGSEGDINTYDGFADYEKWIALTESNQTAGPGDVSNVIGVGQLLLSADHSDTLTAILALARSAEELRATVEATERAWFAQSGVQPISDRANLSMYPSPFQHVLHLSLPSDAGVTRVRILDLLGRVLHTQEISGATASIRLDVPAGSYMVDVQSASLHVTRIVTCIRD